MNHDRNGRAPDALAVLTFRVQFQKAPIKKRRSAILSGEKQPGYHLASLLPKASTLLSAREPTKRPRRDYVCGHSEEANRQLRRCGRRDLARKSLVPHVWRRTFLAFEGDGKSSCAEWAKNFFDTYERSSPRTHGRRRPTTIPRTPATKVSTPVVVCRLIRAAWNRAAWGQSIFFGWVIGTYSERRWKFSGVSWLPETVRRT